MAGTVLDIESIIHADKTCSKCFETKPMDCYYKCRHGKDGRLAYCKDCRNKQNVAWAKAHPEAVKAIKENHAKNNPTASSVYGKRHAIKNPSKAARAHATRRANMAKATVPLTDEDKQKIKELYWLAKDLEVITGQKYHVDHVVAISRGGIHHWSNLQILPKDLNQKKWAN